MGDIDLLMIGKTGNGKSALGNSILRRKAFQSMSTTTSVTKQVEYEVSEFNDRVIKVVDGPGVGDTRMDNEESIMLVLDAISYAISANTQGYHAFLLVIRFGGRFGKEDQDTIDFLKKIFGDTFVRDFCILVMTCGDNFDIDENQSFPDWCSKQEGVFRLLLQECNKRVLLFDNRTKDEKKIVKQINDLVKMVDQVSSQRSRYKDENFDKAKTARDRMMIEAKNPMIRDETMRETSLIIQKLEKIQATVEHENCDADLKKLLTRTELLYDSIRTQDNGTGALHDLVDTVKSLKYTIQDEIKFASRVAQEKERIIHQEAEKLRAFHEEIRRLKEEYEGKLKQERLEEQNRRAREKEQEDKLRELYERERCEREKRKVEQSEQLEKERLENKKKREELERKYSEAKMKNDEGFFDSVVSFVAWPFRALFGAKSV